MFEADARDTRPAYIEEGLVCDWNLLLQLRHRAIAINGRAPNDALLIVLQSLMSAMQYYYASPDAEQSDDVRREMLSSACARFNLPMTEHQQEGLVHQLRDQMGHDLMEEMADADVEARDIWEEVWIPPDPNDDVPPPAADADDGDGDLPVEGVPPELDPQVEIDPHQNPAVMDGEDAGEFDERGVSASLEDASACSTK
jgi:hypothetical protein